MQAYAVMDGGGVKGAALAGCLLAAEEAGVQFVGYGGTSAGSIVALLACVGYSGAELDRLMTEELNFGKLLSEVEKPLAKLKQLPKDIEGLNAFNAISRLLKYRKTFAVLNKDLGLAGCGDFERALLGLVQRKLGADVSGDFTFSDLAERGLPPLKVVASNLSTRQPVVFSASSRDIPVLKAVQASMSYPFIFKPLTHDDELYVDGGLCSNLPAFVFDQERSQDKRPLIAFDLVSRPGAPTSPYGIGAFIGDLLETALEAGDFLRRQTKEFYRVVVPTDGVETLNFNISEAQLKALVYAGRAETASFIQNELAPWTQAENQVERLQASFAPADEVRFVLEQFVRDLEDSLQVTQVRAAISLPTGRETRIVVYQFGMDDDPDQDLEMAQDAGCSGQCWLNRGPTYADLEEAAREPGSFGLTPEQQAKVRKDRKAMLSVPIFERMPLSERDNPDPPLLGVLSFDTDMSLEQLGWIADEGSASNRLESAIVISSDWSRIITKVLR